MASVSPGEKVVARHRQAILLLLQICSGVSRTPRSGVTKGIIPLRLGVHVRVSLYMMIGSCNSDAAGDVKTIEVNTSWSCDLRRC
jgi:hypothetical protein